jgi:hypothetical protein
MQRTDTPKDAVCPESSWPSLHYSFPLLARRVAQNVQDGPYAMTTSLAPWQLKTVSYTGVLRSFCIKPAHFMANDSFQS